MEENKEKKKQRKHRKSIQFEDEVSNLQQIQKEKKEPQKAKKILKKSSKFNQAFITWDDIKMDLLIQALQKAENINKKKLAQEITKLYNEEVKNFLNENSNETFESTLFLTENEIQQKLQEDLRIVKVNENRKHQMHFGKDLYQIN